MNKEKATIYDYVRMCRSSNDCQCCPLWDYEECDCSIKSFKSNEDRMNETILNWCKEHPVKTRQDKFLEHYPHARAKKISVLDICPKAIDIRVQCKSENGLSCPNCQKSYWLAEVEE